MIGLAALVLVSCTESYEWNQKVTVVIGTPKGDVAGSSVQAISFKKYKKALLMEGNSSSWTVTGEAVAVPLPNGRYVFALIESDTIYGESHHLLQGLVHPRIGARTHEALARAAAQPVGSRFPLTGKLRPMLVTFSDISDPRSILEITPSNISRNIGAGYSIKSIYLEVTDEEPRRVGIRDIIPFLNYKNFNPEEKPIKNALRVELPRGLSLRLTRYSFEREE